MTKTSLALADTWERLAREHEEQAARLAVPIGVPAFDQQNQFLADLERWDAQRCRLFAKEFLLRVQK